MLLQPCAGAPLPPKFASNILLPYILPAMFAKCLPTV
jgi:hypothetical protein